jgi:hypothetical protein
MDRNSEKESGRVLKRQRKKITLKKIEKMKEKERP